MSRRSTPHRASQTTIPRPSVPLAESLTGSLALPPLAEPKQSPRDTDDPRVLALADRMDDLVCLMRHERAEDGKINAATSAAFRATESAYWLVCQEPDQPLPAAEQEQTETALADYTGPRAEPSPMRPLEPCSAHLLDTVPLPV